MRKILDEGKLKELSGKILSGVELLKIFGYSSNTMICDTALFHFLKRVERDGFSKYSPNAKFIVIIKE